MTSNEHISVLDLAVYFDLKNEQFDYLFAKSMADQPIPDRIAIPTRYALEYIASEPYYISPACPGYIREMLCDIENKKKSYIMQDANENAGNDIYELKINNRVSNRGDGKSQVRYTIEENKDALPYIAQWRSEDKTPYEIVKLLETAGGSYAVVGCLMFPEVTDIEKAKEKVQNIHKAASRKTNRKTQNN